MSKKQLPPPPWSQRCGKGKVGVGIIASEARRRPGTRKRKNLSDLLENHATTLGSAFLFVTWGTYYDLFLRSDLQRDLEALQNSPNDEDKLKAYLSRKEKWEPRNLRFKSGFPLRPGKRGGILQMAEHLEESAGTDRVRTLIFLADPADVEEQYPEDLALFRSAVRNDVVYLTTYWAAAHWAAFEKHPKIRRSGRAKVAQTNPRRDTLALIAHNEKKLELSRWVVEHRDRIRLFRRIVTTGTTGKWVERFLIASRVPGRKVRWIDKMASGPKGGDVEIAGAVMRGKIQHVVFFVDPMTSHPHEADIHALLRVCSMPGLQVNVRLNERSATSWIATVRKGP